MDNAIYVGLSRQMTLQRALDVAANNLANVDTVGFKVEESMVATEQATPAAAARNAPINFVLDHGVARNFGQGSVDPTGNPYDVAIDGDAFFSISTANGTRYTRDGRFSVNAGGQLVTKAGDAVQGEGGGGITLDPLKSPPAIGKDGVITQTDSHGQVVQVGKLEVVRITPLSALSKAGDNLYSADLTAATAPARDVTLRQAAVERSNVQAVAQITNLIDITRAYERVSNMLASTEDLSTRAVDRLGRAA